MNFTTRGQAREVLEFWRAAGADKWFVKDAQFDAQFRDGFLDLHFAVARREKEDWLAEPDSALALVLLLDQFPRNVFRGTAHMFATDPLALYYTRQAIEAGFMTRIDEELRLFLCVPFIHSEALADQVEGVELYRQYAPQGLSFAIEHHEIIERFGRFPHRNPSLGRQTTAEEQAFLDEGGFAG